LHERENETVKAIYPGGVQEALPRDIVRFGDLTTTTAILEAPEHGLPDAVLNTTDVLVCRGHKAHAAVADALADKVHQRVLADRGLIVIVTEKAPL
jgi:trehalose utilization protein